jgi:hypothetical protein
MVRGQGLTDEDWIRQKNRRINIEYNRILDPRMLPAGCGAGLSWAKSKGRLLHFMKTITDF